MKKYIPKDIEPKWQKKWKEDGLYLTDLFNSDNKYYILVELPYTSGDLHMGHWFTFTMGDILARYRKMQGFNVLFPNGFDAFGLPAENAAIKHNIHPRDWTYQNMERMRQQFETLGTSIDWTKTMVACDPKYYKWNQWIFLKMLDKGLAYRGKLLSNWCPNDQTVLANENVEDGKCWRCGAEVIQKEIDQWFFRITSFAEKLLWKEFPQADWPKHLREGQNNWIGKREGTIIKFQIPNTEHQIDVFTTRGDTLYGATFLVIAPEHPLIEVILKSFEELKIQKETRDEVEKYIKAAKKKSQLERLMEQKEKTGVFTGLYAINPINDKQIPVWTSDYAVMGFGTGALFGDAHDERDVAFARKYEIPLKATLISGDKERDKCILELEECFTGDGILVDSGQFSGLTSKEAREQVAEWLAKHGKGGRKTTYHLHDWSISRQRYWGTPIPIIHCSKCGVVPVPEKDLPVELPYELGSSASQSKVDYSPQGKPPLATAEDWLNVACPKCGGKAKREAETMDTFVDSAWYFFRYLDGENDQEIFDKKIADEWMPLEIYIGGPEHTLGHALYARFFTMVFKELGLINFEEFAKKRIHHGTILGPDGSRMSKSRGNVVNPDSEVKSFGADAIRLYLMFLGPFDIVTSWNTDGVNGVYHFLQRVWGLQERVSLRQAQGILSERAKRVEDIQNNEDLRIMHKTIKKITEDLAEVKFNTSIAALMEWLNYLSRKEKVIKEEYKTFLILLAPFTPHITEQLWQDLGEKYSIHQQTWPQFDNKYLEEEEIKVVVQINGKVRDILLIEKDIISSEKDIEKRALKSLKVQKFLAGKIVKKTVYITGKIISLVTN